MTMTAESRASKVWSKTERVVQAHELVTPSPRDITAETGVTYRQLDYWVRKGYLHPDDALPGSGHFRSWPDKEIVIAREMLRLSEAGLTTAAAAIAARSFVNGDVSVELAPGIILDIEGDRQR